MAAARPRIRPETFADHHTQARLFWRSMTWPEQLDIVSAFAFDLGKVDGAATREGLLDHLALIDAGLSVRVATALGMDVEADAPGPAVAPRSDPEPPPAPRWLAITPMTLEGRRIAVLVTDGVDDGLLASLAAATGAERARLSIVALTIVGVKSRARRAVAAHHALSCAPSMLFDAIVLAPSKAGARALAGQPAAVDWLGDAFDHRKAIGHVSAAAPLFRAADVSMEADEGVVSVDAGVATFLTAASKHRVWGRDPGVRAPG